MFGKIKEWAEKRKAAKEIVALVVLLETPRLLDAKSVEQSLVAAGVLSGTRANPALVEERTSYLRGTIDGFELTIASLPAQYRGLANPRSGLEARLADGMSRHQGFMTIDCWKAPEGVSRREARSVMAKIAAALTDASTLLYYDWTTARMCLADPEIVEMLREGNMDEAVQTIGDAVMNVDHDRKDTRAAIAEAQRRWPEFVAAFSTRGEEPFIAKLRFSHGDNTEHMWVEVTACDAESVTGVVANKPFRIPRPRQGDVVTGKIEDLSDWVMVQNGEPVGGFLEEILRNGK